jgi:hypothetical protein
MAKTINTSAVNTAVIALCTANDDVTIKVDALKALVVGVTSRKELREIIIVGVATKYKCTVEAGQRGGKLIGDNAKTAQKQLERIMGQLLGASAKAAVEIEFDDAIVKAMKAVLAKLEVYAAYEVDGKKVGDAKALALLVAETKDRI